MNLYKSFFKRAIDITVSGCGLLALSVPLSAIAVWLHFANKGAGAFFFQERPGKDGRIFNVVKFKSMTDARDDNGMLLPNADRITKVGAFIRKTSLDELPQLWNVFKGDMSLIGPRPLLPQYLPYYTDREKKRHNVRPGITGLAQVNGRNHLSWDERLELDVVYVENLSLGNDFKILFKTIVNVLNKKDIEVVPKGKFLYEERKKSNTPSF